MSQLAWQEYGVRETDNVQRPDDALFFKRFQNLAPVLETRLGLGWESAVCVLFSAKWQM